MKDESRARRIAGVEVKLRLGERPISGRWAERSGERECGRPGGVGRPSPADFAARIMGNDKNGDGKVTKDELPEFLRRILDRADTNKDGAIDNAEAKKMAERFGGRGRPSGAGRGPGGRPEGAPPRRPN